MDKVEVVLKDHGEETIKCDECGKALMHYRVYAVSPKKTKISATCPFCKNTSSSANVEGEFYYGPIGKDEPYTSTIIYDNEIVNGEARFIIKRR